MIWRVALLYTIIYSHILSVNGIKTKTQFGRPDSVQGNPSFPIRVNLRHEEKVCKVKNEEQGKRDKKWKRRPTYLSYFNAKRRKKKAVRGQRSIVASSWTIWAATPAVHFRSSKLRPMKALKASKALWKSFGDSHIVMQALGMWQWTVPKFGGLQLRVWCFCAWLPTW